MTNSILVIDDNQDIRENIAEILTLAGYRTFTAENGKEGVETALRELPSLIVCDIMMPELDGFGVLHLLKKHPETERIPFIFLTARVERTDFRKGMEMGADDYISKPFEDIELLRAVEMRLKKSLVLDKGYPPSSAGLTRFFLDLKTNGLIAELPDSYEIDTLEKKRVLYQENKRPRFLYYLISGKVKCFKINEEGKEYITSLYAEGDFIGYNALLEDTVYDNSAVILEEAEILSIAKSDFLQLVFKDAGIAAKFIHLISANVREQEERLLVLAYSSLRKRVASALVGIAHKYNIAENSGKLEISRDDLASYVGTATESLIRTLSDFKSEHLIEINSGKISISNLEKLQNLRN